MSAHLRRATALAAVLVCVALAATASPALGYGKATWQTALTGTFVFPTSGVGLGFWGWCDFGGGTQTAGTDADCQLAEYLHLPSGSGWTCQLSVDGTSWYANQTTGTFHMDGSLAVHGHLTPDQADVCVGFYVFGDTIPYSGRSFTDVETFIPSAAGHYAIPPSVIFGPGVVGEFNFTVALNPTA